MNDANTSTPPQWAVGAANIIVVAFSNWLPAGISLMHLWSTDKWDQSRMDIAAIIARHAPTVKTCKWTRTGNSFGGMALCKTACMPHAGVKSGDFCPHCGGKIEVTHD